MYFQMMKEPFDMHIKNCLKTDLSQPILKLARDSNPSVKECYEVTISNRVKIHKFKYGKYFLDFNSSNAGLSRRAFQKI